MLWDEEEGKKRVLTEREFLWFFLSVISGVGFNPKGCRFDLENAKATIRDPWLTRLQSILGEKFVFNFGSRPAHYARAAHAGQLEGKPKGNFRTKALLESFWNPLDNQTAMLAGQVGKDREHSPAQLHGAEKYTAQLMRTAEATGTPLSSLQFPFEHYHSWVQHAHEAVARMNAATDHAMEGWEKCGFLTRQWRENAESQFWLGTGDFEALPEVTRAIIAKRLEENPALVKFDRLSRVQVANRLRKSLKQFPLHHWPEVLGREFALNGGEPMTVGRTLAGTFAFECEEIDSDAIYFYARDQRGFLKNGDKFVCFVNPYLPTHLVACDEQLRVAALCPRYEPATDDASLKAAMGQQVSYEAAASARLNLRHDDAARRNKAMRDHNDGVTIGNTPEARERARALKRFTGDVAEMTDPEPLPAPAPASGIPSSFSADALLD
jgi:hypothetical protein